MNPLLVGKVLELAGLIQQIPAPTFGEGQRAAFVAGRFQAEGLSDVTLDPLGNVYGRLPGRGSPLAGEGGALPLVVSAHLDTVFPTGTSLDLRYEEGKVCGPGIGDNSLGVAGLFGLLWSLRDIPARSLQIDPAFHKKPSPGLDGDIWFVGNVGEEGLGNLCGMTAVVDRFGAGVRAYIVVEGMALGQIYHRGLSVKRYRISAHTAGGHAWVDYGQPSAIHELSALITRITSLPVPSQPRSSMNVGVISGGTTVNTIAAQAECLLDLRSEDGEILTRLAAEVEALVGEGNRPGVHFSWEVVGFRPSGALQREHPLVQAAVRCLEAQGVTPTLSIGSTDANLPLSRGLPAVTIGLTNGGGAHTMGEYINIAPLERGLAQLYNLVLSLGSPGKT